MNKHLYSLDRMLLVLLLSFYTLSFGQEQTTTRNVLQEDLLIEYVEIGNLKQLKKFGK